MPILQEAHSEDQADSGISSETPNTERERDRDELTRSETETSTESARVTVRTQMKEKKHRSKEFDLKKELNPTCGKACIMDMEPMNNGSFEHKLSKRSMTLPISQTTEGSTDPTDPKSPSPSNIKVLQSDSLKKSCYYISQNAIIQSSSSQSTGGELSLDSQQSFTDYKPHFGRPHRPTLKQTMSKIQLRMSSSLPTLSKNWTAFEIDPDDETLSIEEMEALSVAAQRTKKRMNTRLIMTPS